MRCIDAKRLLFNDITYIVVGNEITLKCCRLRWCKSTSTRGREAVRDAEKLADFGLHGAPVAGDASSVRQLNHAIKAGRSSNTADRKGDQDGTAAEEVRGNHPSGFLSSLRHRYQCNCKKEGLTRKEAEGGAGFWRRPWPVAVHGKKVTIGWCWGCRNRGSSSQAIAIPPSNSGLLQGDICNIAADVGCV